MAPKRPVNGSSTSPSAKPAPSSTVSPATPPSSTIPIAITANSSPQEILLGVWQRYFSQTSQRTKILDAFMAFLIAVGVVQFVYCVLAGNYPFNAFLSGFSAAVGQFVLTASLRMQTSAQNAKRAPKGQATAKDDQSLTSGVSPERLVKYACSFSGIT
ncbi:oligosaccharyltransferase complex subunit epsilon [Ophidiomyces ophidiicola]|nr:oligosaccharyltransferase complex subunit epsilon [Ophidiomyces ophidiicola]